MDVVEFRLKREDAEMIRSAVYNYALTLRIDQDVITNHAQNADDDGEIEESIDRFLSVLNKRERYYVRLLRKLDDILDN